VIRAGQLDRRIAIQAPHETVGASGVVSTEWLPLSPPVTYARKLSASAATRVLGSERVTDASVVWSIRYRDDVNTKCRLVHDGRNYRITSTAEGTGRGEELLVITEIEEPERGE